jgi:hypothetical protein
MYTAILIIGGTIIVAGLAIIPVAKLILYVANSPKLKTALIEGAKAVLTREEK